MPVLTGPPAGTGSLDPLGQMEADRITSDPRNSTMFANGRLKGRTHVFHETNDVTDTDDRQPAAGGTMHPDMVDDIIARSGRAAGIPSPATELRQQRRRQLLQSLGPPLTRL